MTPSVKELLGASPVVVGVNASKAISDVENFAILKFNMGMANALIRLAAEHQDIPEIRVWIISIYAFVKDVLEREWPRPQAGSSAAALEVTRQ